MTNADADSVAQSQNNKLLLQIIKFSTVSDWRFKDFWLRRKKTIVVHVSGPNVVHNRIQQCINWFLISIQ